MLISFAKQIDPRVMPRPAKAIQRAGLALEKKFLKQALKFCPPSFEFEHNPHFGYNLDGKEKFCIPDLLITDKNDLVNVIVVEIKQTFVPLALTKLQTLYCPIVSKALSKVARPLVVCLHLSPGAPPASGRILDAVKREYPLYQWLGGDAPILF